MNQWNDVPEIVEGKTFHNKDQTKSVSVGIDATDEMWFQYQNGQTQFHTSLTEVCEQIKQFVPFKNTLALLGFGVEPYYLLEKYASTGDLYFYRFLAEMMKTEVQRNQSLCNKILESNQPKYIQQLVRTNLKRVQKILERIES